MPQVTNILALPLVHMDVITGNNEDWIDVIKYLVSDGSTAPDPLTLPQIDLRGITFEMSVRRRPEDHEVVLDLATWNHKLQIGAFPNSGFLIFGVTKEEMQTKRAGVYVADVIASDGNYVRRCIEMDLTIVEGVTK